MLAAATPSTPSISRSASLSTTQSLWVVPEPQPHNGLLLHETRLLHGIAAPECARLPIRAPRVFVCGDAHSHVAEQLPHAGDLVGGCVGPCVRRLESPLEELCGLDIRVLLLGPLRGVDRVAPRLRPTLGPVVVQRQKLRRIISPPRFGPRDHIRDAPVELPPAPVREPFVGAVANQGVSEPEAAGDVRIALDELAQAAPRLGVRRGRWVIVEHVRDHRTGERRTENRRPAQERAVCRSEPVDTRGDERLDGVRQLLPGLARLLRSRELSEEKWVACASVEDRPQLLFRELSRRRRPLE